VVSRNKCFKETGNVQSVEQTSQSFHLNQTQNESTNYFVETVTEKRDNLLEVEMAAAAISKDRLSKAIGNVQSVGQL